MRLAVVAAMACAFGCALLGAGCGDAPETRVVLDNRYPPASSSPLIVFHAAWQAVSFQTPVLPGMSSDPMTTVPALPASANLAYVLLAPGWDPTSATTPPALVVLQSRQGFAVHLDNTLHIPVDDTTFTGNCAAGNFLTQAQADFITQLVFPGDFGSLRYDAATCTTTATGDARAP